MSDRDGSRDGVEHPSHYQSDGVECIDAMYAISPEMAVNFAVCSAMKYLDRAGLKDDEGQDLRKAKECWHMAKRLMVRGVPKSADGAPIHVGDTVYTTDGSKAHAERICIMANTTHVKCAFSDGRIIEFQPTELTHTRPDSWERIADELDNFADENYACGLLKQEIKDFAERIRKLAAKEDK